MCIKGNVEMDIIKINGLYNNGIEKLEGVDGIYYTFDKQFDYFEITERKQGGFEIGGNELSFFFYPSNKIYTPFKKEYGIYYDRLCLIYKEDNIYFTRADFNTDELMLYKFNIKSNTLDKLVKLNMQTIDTYNLKIAFEPLTICSENSEQLKIYYPEKLTIKEDGNESFDFRDNDKFYFSAWFEEYDNKNYNYYEMYIIKDRESNIIQKGFGVINQMSDGKYIIV